MPNNQPKTTPNLPNFICPGAQKAATTTLHETLIQHPDVYLPDEKEAHFFDRDDRFERGPDYYEKRFYAGSEGYQVVGDITPRYMYYRWVPERIRQTLGPKLKFVFLLRDPVERAYSQYWMHRGRGSEELEFDKAVDRELERRSRLSEERIVELEKSGDLRGYVARGFYTTQIRRFLERFPRERMLFVLFDEFITDMRFETKRILSFLGLRDRGQIEYGIESNPASEVRFKGLKNLIRSSPVRKIAKLLVPSPRWRQTVVEWFDHFNRERLDKPPLPVPMRRRLIDVYGDEIEELEEILERQLTDWKQTE
jgi:hypothetical protein